jgi:hypothetical protein
VYVATREDPVVASRSENTILNAMAGVDEMSRSAEAVAVLGVLTEEMGELPAVLRRMLRREGDFDVDAWVRRLEALTGGATEAAGTQEDLFSDD